MSNQITGHVCPRIIILNFLICKFIEHVGLQKGNGTEQPI